MSAVFFTDRDLGKQFPDILARAGFVVHRHGDLFAPTTPDAEWLERVSANGWIAITHDKRIRYKPNELAAVVKHNAALLVVIGDATHAELASAVVAMKDTIVDFVSKQQRPFIAKIYRPTASDLKKNPNAIGRIEKWYP